MTSAHTRTSPSFVEIELKLALPGADTALVAQRLARSPLLARRKPTRQMLRNVYYDTPDQQLRGQRVALRTRQVGTEGATQWLQTLKMAGTSDSALSQRGEWESPVPGAALSRKALKATPWTSLDPDGAVFKGLAPAFSTDFERTLWTVRRRNGSVVEVALDQGEVIAGGQRAPIFELELELKAGPPEALFELAQELARTVALVPASISKAQRGYALAQGTLDAPLTAQPARLKSCQSLTDAAGLLLRDMFNQFTTNLIALSHNDDPELAHQARIGWRRFKSTLRLWSPVLGQEARPSWAALQPLLDCLGALRDLDVARLDTLPPLANAFVAGDPRRSEVWQSMAASLDAATTLQRKTVRYALQDPSVGACLLLTTQWLAGLAGTPASSSKLKPWARQQMDHLHHHLKRARKRTTTLEQIHRTRLLAKRLRYGLEALQSLLPKAHTRRWREQAVALQNRLGNNRDVALVPVLLAGLDIDAGLLAFLRGVAVGRAG
ncbi:CYTH and CHAD domain-containing protein [Rhodoferax sp. PAMC 29310]|uniref:CYTH and CHAD domain-containing protein n=1 Tax=Rhodoferax sp. PAMC 29310 TaxID=2822760 RepID=UPI001B321E55|nr:CYTH and CHAD domain-containing protein [Rhodoferax sp. PAMC 29310]